MLRDDMSCLYGRCVSFLYDGLLALVPNTAVVCPTSRGVASEMSSRGFHVFGVLVDVSLCEVVLFSCPIVVFDVVLFFGCCKISL